VLGIRRAARPDDEPRLDPVRWPRTVRRGTLVRGALVAVLLSTAAAVLYTGEPAARGCAEPLTAQPGPRPASAPAPESPGGARSGDARPRVRLPLPAGAVGVAVSLAEPVALAVVRPGDRVDLLTVPAAPEPPVTLASAALVLATAGGAVDDPPVAPGALYLALTPEQAKHTVALQARVRFAVVVRG